MDCWSDKNELRPRDLAISCNKKIYFDCDTCPHDFCSPLNSIHQGSWCPYCADNYKKRCSKDDCDFCFNNSFASYTGLTLLGKKKVDCWSDKNELTPREISVSNVKKCHFDCDTCPHEFYSSLSSVTRVNHEGWCPYCCHSPKRCSSDDFLRKKSIYIAAYNMYQKAGNTSKMNLAKQQFPTIEEIFVRNRKEGEQINTACWINETVSLTKR